MPPYTDEDDDDVPPYTEDDDDDVPEYTDDILTMMSMFVRFHNDEEIWRCADQREICLQPRVEELRRQKVVLDSRF